MAERGIRDELTVTSWKAAKGGMAVVKMAHYVSAKNLAGGLAVLAACNTPQGIVLPPKEEETTTTTTNNDDPDTNKEPSETTILLPSYTPQQMELHKATIAHLVNLKSYHFYNYNIPDPIPPDMKLPLPPPEASDASIPHALLEVLTSLRLRYEEGVAGGGGGVDVMETHAAASTGETLQLDANKLAAAAGGTYDEEADPMNAPEVVNAVMEFKRSLEERDVKSRKRRVDIITEAMEKKVKELVERGRAKKSIMTTNPGVVTDTNGTVPPPDGTVEDTGKRGVSNLPAWMTQGGGGGEPTTNPVLPPFPTNPVTEDNKRKFVPSEANRDDINVRKQRIDMQGASLAEIRAANEAADKSYNKREDILAAGTMFPPLSLGPSTSPEQIQSYITEKIVEHLGEEESTLIEFIMKELNKGVKTVALLEEMKMVLDEDAEEFVVGLYKRMTPE